MSETYVCTDLEKLTEIVATVALESDPFARWVFPPEMRERESRFRDYLHVWFRFLLKHEGTAILTKGDKAAMIWRPSDRKSIPAQVREDTMHECYAACGPVADRLEAVMDKLDSISPPENPPYLHVEFAIATPPEDGPDPYLALVNAAYRAAYEQERELYIHATSPRYAMLWRGAGGKDYGGKSVMPGTDITMFPVISRRQEIRKYSAGSEDLIWSAAASN